MAAIIGIEIDRETGKVISADMPPVRLDVKALWDRELKPRSLMEVFWEDCYVDNTERDTAGVPGRSEQTGAQIQPA